MLISQISVFVENRPGRLAEITGILARAGIDIRALSIADTSDFGILRLIVSSPELAERELRAAGVTVSNTAVVAARLADEPGALHAMLRILSDNGIVIEYAYAFITRKDSDAYVILKTEDSDKTVETLTAHGQRILSPVEIYAL